MALLDRCDGHYIVTPQIICNIVVLKVLKLSFERYQTKYVPSAVLSV